MTPPPPNYHHWTHRTSLHEHELDGEIAIIEGTRADEAKYTVSTADDGDGGVIVQLYADWPDVRFTVAEEDDNCAQIQLAHGLADNVGDGYHTLGELYDWRSLLQAMLFNEWAQAGKFEVHKSWRHHTGEECCGGGWFIVVATLPTGQISNHYPAKEWDRFQIPERELPAVWDGHDAREAARRMAAFLARRT